MSSGIEDPNRLLELPVTRAELASAILQIRGAYLAAAHLALSAKAGSEDEIAVAFQDFIAEDTDVYNTYQALVGEWPADGS